MNRFVKVKVKLLLLQLVFILFFHDNFAMFVYVVFFLLQLMFKDFGSYTQKKNVTHSELMNAVFILCILI